MKTVDDPNINPVWDRLLGDDTNTGMLRLLSALGLFFVVGGLASLLLW
ncbi:MAG: hypothetical protein ACK4PN_04020 [Allorhizobium sp.]